MSAPIVLLSCVKSKRNEPCRASEMYTSALFRKSMTYARTLKPKRIFILSAKYGLLSPEDIIEPYEQTLKTMNVAGRRAWADGVLLKLRENCDLETDSFIFLVGDAYRRNLVPHIRHYTVPMKGLGMGKQLQWLGSQVA